MDQNNLYICGEMGLLTDKYAFKFSWKPKHTSVTSVAIIIRDKMCELNPTQFNNFCSAPLTKYLASDGLSCQWKERGGLKLAWLRSTVHRIWKGEENGRFCHENDEIIQGILSYILKILS
jgi:hypothetical protein